MTPKSRYAAAGIFVVTALALAGCSATASASTPASSPAASKVEPLVLYAAEGYDAVMGRAFTKKTGIPVKVYLSTMKGSNWRKIWDALREAGEEVPNWEEDAERSRRALESESRITTTIDIRPVLERKRAALFAHGSQINDSWFSKIPPEIAEQAFGYEYFIRAVDTTGAPIPETDLFAGLRTGA